MHLCAGQRPIALWNVPSWVELWSFTYARQNHHKGARSTNLLKNTWARNESPVIYSPSCVFSVEELLLRMKMNSVLYCQAPLLSVRLTHYNLRSYDAVWGTDWNIHKYHVKMHHVRFAINANAKFEFAKPRSAVVPVCSLCVVYYTFSINSSYQHTQIQPVSAVMNWAVVDTRLMIVSAGGECDDIYYRVNPPGSPSTRAGNPPLFIMINWGHLCNVGCVPFKALLWLIQI